MTTKSVYAQGTELFVLDDSASPAVVRKVGQLAPGISSFGGQRSVGDQTTLDSVAKEKFPGLLDNGAFTFDIIVNPQDAGHQYMDTLSVALNPTDKNFYIGLSDTASGTGLPTFTGSVTAGTLVLKQPKSASSPYKFGRTGWTFVGFVKQYSYDMQTDKKVVAKAAIEINGARTQGIQGAAWV